MTSGQHALNNAQLVRAALVVVVGFLASGAFGFVRVAIVSAQFGTSEALDAFYAAQRIPELVFTLVAGGALGSSFIPVYARRREQDSAAAWAFASAVMTLSALAAGALGLLVALLAEPITAHVLLPSRDAETQALTANMMRLMMVTPFIFSISGLVMGILQSHGLFFLPSVAVSMNSLGIIIGALLIAPVLPPLDGVGQVGSSNVYGLAYGAVLSAVLHLAVQVRGLVTLKARLRFLPDWRMEGVLTVLKLMLPRTLGLAVVQINFVVNIILASGMAAGSLTALNTAFLLLFFVLGVIGQSIGAAVFPTLAALRAAGDWAGFEARLMLAVRGVVFLALPASVFLVLLPEPLVTLFERGAWSDESTRATAWALAFYATGIVGFALLEVLSRAFYALEDTWTPVLVGTGAMVSNILLSLLFVRVIGTPDDLTRGAFGGLALANALTTNVEAGVLAWLLRRRLGSFGGRTLWAGLARMVAAAAGMAGVLWLLAGALPLAGLALGVVAGSAAGLAYLALGLLLRVPEARLLPQTVRARLLKTK